MRLRSLKRAWISAGNSLKRGILSDRLFLFADGLETAGAVFEIRASEGGELESDGTPAADLKEPRGSFSSVDFAESDGPAVSPGGRGLDTGGGIKTGSLGLSAGVFVFSASDGAGRIDDRVDGGS